jgi:hypothetical protein
MKAQLGKKFEARNSKLEANSNDQKTMTGTEEIPVSNSEHSRFDIVSDFDIRISDLIWIV